MALRKKKNHRKNEIHAPDKENWRESSLFHLMENTEDINLYAVVHYEKEGKHTSITCC